MKTFFAAFVLSAFVIGANAQEAPVPDTEPAVCETTANPKTMTEAHQIAAARGAPPFAQITERQRVAVLAEVVKQTGKSYDADSVWWTVDPALRVWVMLARGECVLTYFVVGMNTWANVLKSADTPKRDDSI